MNQIDFEYKPRFFQILSEDDCLKYNLLRTKFSAHQKYRIQRNSDFSSNLDLIKGFCVRNDEDDWKRDIVCGIFWINEYIAVNNSQFSILIDENKSSINNSFKKLGYSVINDKKESLRLLSEKIPFLRNNNHELKEWTLRRFEAETPSPKLPPFNVSTYFTFNTPKAPSNHSFFSPPQSPLGFPEPPPIERPLSRPTAMDFFNDPFCLLPDFLAEDIENEEENNNNEEDENGDQM